MDAALKTKFVSDIEARLLEIGKLIAAAPPKHRRSLQNERADFENKLRRATT